MAPLLELAKHAPSLAAAVLALAALWMFRPQVAAAIGRMSSLKAGPVEMSLAEQRLASAASDANRNNLVVATTVPKMQVQVTRADQERALRRAERCAEVLRGRRILWIDDSVTNNRRERELFEALGLKIEQVQSNAAARAAMAPDGGGYDLLISDIARADGAPDGIAFAEEYRQRPADQRVPLIFYVTVLRADAPVPLGAFGITNRPDELLHLVIDALERRA